MVRELPALIKHVGRGARLAKDLPRDEAAEVMSALLSGRATPVQTGGFLMAMRMKSEAPAELAGFVDALRAALSDEARTMGEVPGGGDRRPLVDVDLHGDGRAGRPALSLASACLAASAGARVLLRTAAHSRFAGQDHAAAAAALGVDPGRGLGAARRGLAGPGVAFVDLADLVPGARTLLDLRAELGVRTFINTSVKLVDPAGSRRAVVGIFHGPYHEPVAAALAALGVTRAAVVQAPGGLPEPSPDRPVKIGLVDGGAAASPSAWDGASALIPGVSAAPPPVCEGPAALATLLEAVMTTPETAPPGAVRMVILGAALLLWAAGLSPSLHDPGTLSQLAVALARHDAERTWRALATCYASW